MSNTPTVTNQQQDFSLLKVLNVLLYNNDGSRKRNITALIKEIVIIEDVFCNSMYGHINIKDAIDLLNGGPDYKDPNSFVIAGEEFIEIRFQSNYARQNKDPVVYKFAVYSISDMVYKQNNIQKDYTLRFCSTEQIIDATTVVMKAYSKQNSDNVKDLCRDYLNIDDGSGQVSTSVPTSNTASQPAQTTPAATTKSPAPGTAPVDQNTETQTPAALPVIPFSTQKKLALIQPTKGMQKVVIPRLSPFQAAEFFARRSIGDDEQFSSGSFLFFENQVGYNFCDIEYLIKTGIDKLMSDADVRTDYTYYHENPLLNLNDPNYDAQREYKTIIRMNHLKYFDTIDKLKFGMYESDTIVYDYVNHKFTPRRFRFTNNNEKDNSKTWVLGKALDNESFPENSSTFLNKVISKDDTSNKYTRKFFLPKTLDNQLPDTFLDDIYPSRASYFTRLAQNMYQIHTYGDTSVRAGDVIVLNLPKGNARDTNLGDIDPRNSGFFLVGTIKHILTHTSYVTVMDIYKNASNERILSTSDAQTNFDDNKAPHMVNVNNAGQGTQLTNAVPPADPTDPEQKNTPNDSPEMLKM